MKKIIDGYSGGSSSVYRGLGKPGSRDSVGSFHPSFSSAGSCHTKAMVMKTREKITTGIKSLTSSP